MFISYLLRSLVVSSPISSSSSSSSSSHPTGSVESVPSFNHKSIGRVEHVRVLVLIYLSQLLTRLVVIFTIWTEPEGSSPPLPPSLPPSLPFPPLNRHSLSIEQKQTTLRRPGGRQGGRQGEVTVEMSQSSSIEITKSMGVG